MKVIVYGGDDRVKQADWSGCKCDVRPVVGDQINAVESSVRAGGVHAVVALTKWMKHHSWHRLQALTNQTKIIVWPQGIDRLTKELDRLVGFDPSPQTEHQREPGEAIGWKQTVLSLLQDRPLVEGKPDSMLLGDVLHELGLEESYAETITRALALLKAEQLVVQQATGSWRAAKVKETSPAPDFLGLPVPATLVMPSTDDQLNARRAAAREALARRKEQGMAKQPQELIDMMGKIGFVSVPDASKKYNLAESTIRGWVEKGHVNDLRKGVFQFVNDDEVKARAELEAKRVETEKAKHGEFVPVAQVVAKAVAEGMAPLMAEIAALRADLQAVLEGLTAPADKEQHRPNGAART